jgi:AAA family ATP:ADP antiporter
MSLAERLRATFDVRPEETRPTALMLAHSFFMGLATVFFETAAAALFLARYGPAVLPFVYLAAALLNAATGAVYTAVQRRTRFRALMSATLVFLLVSTVALRAGLAVSEAGPLVFVLFVWYRAVSALTDLEYWAVAGRLYDVRQAKRLFGLVGSGEVMARITGSFAVPLLVGGLGVANLLVLSAAAMAACLALARAVLPPDVDGLAPSGPAPARADSGGWRESLASFRDRYLLVVFGLAFFGVLAKYFVDFAFLAEMRARFGDAKGLASFFAVFSGVSQTLSLLTRVFVSGRLLGRYGIRVGLLVLPAAQVLCTLAIVAAGVLPASTALVFWLVIANQGIYKTLKHPIDNPSFKVLYQPLPKDRRLSAQIVVETLVTPAAIGAAGVIMLLFTRVVAYHPPTFAVAMLADFGAWLAAAVVAGRAYTGALKEALKRRLDEEDQAFLLLADEGSQRVLRERLRSERPEEVLPALDLLDKARPPGLDQAVLTLLGHVAEPVRLAALSHVERHRPARAAEAVERRLQEEPSPVVRAAAVRCLCVLLDARAARGLCHFLDDERADLRRAATIGLLAAGVAEAEARVGTMARAGEMPARLWAAQVLGEAGQRRLYPTLLPLLEDPDAGVRRAAIAAAGRLRAPELWPAVADNLAHRAFAGAAAAALGHGGAAAVDDLETAFWKTRHGAVRAQIVRVWGRIGGPEAIARLLERLRFPEARVRYEVLVALAACRYHAEGEAALRIESALRTEADDTAWKLAVQRDLRAGEDTALVGEALERERRAGQQRVLLLLSFLLDASAIRRASDNLAHESRDRRAYAVEMLDVTLPAEWRDRLMPLFEELPLDERIARMAALYPQSERPPAERLSELLKQPPGRLASWTVASVSHTLGTARRTEMLTIEKVIILKSVHMFQAASDEILADVANIVEEVDVAKGQVVFEKGDVGDSMYVIAAGRVRVYDGDHFISELGERDIFGELALLDPEPRLASVAALVDARLLRLDREAFLELMEANIEIVRGVLHVLCERLRRQSVREHYADPPPAG